MAYQLKKIHLWPAIKLSFFLFAIAGVIIGIGWAALVSFFANVLVPLVPEGWELGRISGVSLVAGIVVFTLTYAALGVVLTAAVCLVYNVIANWAGGVEIDLGRVGSVLTIAEGGEKRESGDA